MKAQKQILIYKRINSLHRYIESSHLRKNQPSKEDQELLDEYDSLVEQYPNWEKGREDLLANRKMIDNPTPPISGKKWRASCGLPDGLLKYLKKKNKLL